MLAPHIHIHVTLLYCKTVDTFNVFITAGDVHSPAAFFFFFCFILHIHIFYFKVAHKELLVTGLALTQLKIATFASMVLPFLMLVIGEVMMIIGSSGSLFIMVGVNIHVIVEYVVTIAVAIYIFSFRNDMRYFSVTGKYKERSYHSLHSRDEEEDSSLQQQQQDQNIEDDNDNKNNNEAVCTLDDSFSSSADWAAHRYCLRVVD